MASVQQLGYIVFDHHPEHTYAEEDARKDSGLLSRNKLCNFYATGLIGDSMRTWLLKRLGFGKHDAVYFKMKLSMSKDRPISVTDLESFQAYETLLSKRPCHELQRAGMVEVKMLLDTKVRNLMERDDHHVSMNAKRPDVQLLTALNTQLKGKKGMRSGGGVWDSACDSIIANAGDKYVKDYLSERANAKKVYGSAAFFLNPVTMVCPFKSCQALHALNSVNGVKSFYSSRTTHLKKKHAEDPIGQRLIKRWEVCTRCPPPPAPAPS